MRPQAVYLRRRPFWKLPPVRSWIGPMELSMWVGMVFILIDLAHRLG